MPPAKSKTDEQIEKTDQNRISTIKPGIINGNQQKQQPCGMPKMEHCSQNNINYCDKYRECRVKIPMHLFPDFFLSGYLLACFKRPCGFLFHMRRFRCLRRGLLKRVGLLRLFSGNFWFCINRIGTHQLIQ